MKFRIFNLLNLIAQGVKLKISFLLRIEVLQVLQFYHFEVLLNIIDQFLNSTVIIIVNFELAFLDFLKLLRRVLVSKFDY
jgi:hypothetical protein